MKYLLSISLASLLCANVCGMEPTPPDDTTPQDQSRQALVEMTPQDKIIYQATYGTMSTIWNHCPWTANLLFLPFALALPGAQISGAAGSLLKTYNLTVNDNYYPATKKAICDWFSKKLDTDSHNAMHTLLTQSVEDTMDAMEKTEPQHHLNQVYLAVAQISKANYIVCEDALKGKAKELLEQHYLKLSYCQLQNYIGEPILNWFEKKNAAKNGEGHGLQGLRAFQVAPLPATEQ
jgi:hypothetical protein